MNGLISLMLFYEFYKIMVNKVTFVGFRGAIVPIAPLDPPMTVRHFATKWTTLKFVKPRMSRHFYSESKDPSYVGLTRRPECPREDWRGKSCWLHTRESGPEVRPRTRWRDYIFDFTWPSLGVEPAELSAVAVDHEVFRVLLGLLTPRPSPDEKRVWK